jgi:Ca2+-binding RTX toxin-like protein
VTIGEGVLTVKADGSFSYAHNGAEPAPTSFEYTVSDGSLSSNATVTLNVEQVNDAPIALDDPQGFVLSLGSFDTESGAWDNQGVASVDASFNGVSQGISQNSDSNSVGIGVDSDVNNGPAAQIQYDRDSGESEKLSIKFDEPATEGKFKVSHLYAVEGGSSEQGKWTAYLNGVAIASGLFANTDGHVGEFDIDTNGFAFDEIVFEATEFTGGDQGKGDSSDYFLEGIEVSSEGIFAFNEDDVISIPVSELLSNDSDVDTAHSKLSINETFNLVDGDGNPIAGASFEVVGENVVVTLPENYYGKVSFEYNITDGDLTSNDATVSIVINPVNDAPTVSDLVNVVTNEDTPHVLTVSDFGNYSDVESDSLVSIKITSLPVEGQLEYKNSSGEWVSVTSGQELSVADLEGGKVRFVPDTNESGVGYASIGFEISDGSDYSQGNYELNVDVTPVADAPTVNITLGELTGANASLTSSIHSKLIDIANGNASNIDQLSTQDKEVLAKLGLESLYRGTDIARHLIENSSVNLPEEESKNEDSLIIGTDSQDRIDGGYGDDYFFGGKGNDSIFGDDTVHYGDYRDQNDGQDTVIYTGSINDYLIKNLGNSHGGGVDHWVVTDTNGIDTWYDHTNPDDNGDHLYEIERLIFSDAIVELKPDGTHEILQDRVIPVDVDVDLVDTDGSESLVQTITLDGIPEGIEIYVNGQPIMAQANGTFLVPIDSDGNVSFEIKVPFDYEGSLDFPLNVTATSVESLNSDRASTTETVDVTARNYVLKSGSHGDDTINGSEDHDLIVGDVQGIEIIAGEDYNIAFVLDTSGSMGSWVGTAKQEILDVFDELQAAANQGSQPGTVNVLLTEFASGATFIVSVDLSSPTARENFVTQLNTIENLGSGGTNYESGLQSAVDWFGSQPNSNGQNITYFITDGKPNSHTDLDDIPQDEFSKVILDVDSKGQVVTLEDIVNDFNYTYGQTVNYKGNVLIDNYGRVYSPFTGQKIGDIDRSNGNLEYDDKGGDSVQAQHMYQVLAVLSSVEAIGIGSGVNASTLQQYDTDGVVDSNIDVTKLSETILGQDVPLKQGQDTLHGGDGNDILLGDLIDFDSNEQGLSAIQSHVATKTGQDISTVDAEDIHNYVKDNIQEFNQSHQGDKTDYLYGDDGDDVLFGHGGNDVLYGGKGDDILVGGSGNDLLTGGEGDDLFVIGEADFVNSLDVITDFTVTKDHIDISDLLHSGENMDGLLDEVTAKVVDNNDVELYIDRDGKHQTIRLEDAVDQLSYVDLNSGDIQGQALSNLLNDVIYKPQD